MRAISQPPSSSLPQVLPAWTKEPTNAVNLVALPPLAPTAPEALSWDETAKEYTAKLGETNASLLFNVTNVSTSPVTIKTVRASCGCTVPQLPKQPWILQPGESGSLKVIVDLRGKRGTLNKYLSVDATSGFGLLTLKVHIPEPMQTSNSADMRGRNLILALGDRQAVFKDDCVRCHVDPARGKIGAALYQAACGICHESEHRATMVPDLHSVQHPANRVYWHYWITTGKEKSLMPAFGENKGGPLTELQITNLEDYLMVNYPPPDAKTAASPVKGPQPNSDTPPIPGAPNDVPAPPGVPIPK